MAKLTLIKRSVPTCPECIKQEMALESEGIPYKVIDIAHEPDAVEKYVISSVPVLIFEDAEGNEDYRINGFRPADFISEMLK